MSDRVIYDRAIIVKGSELAAFAAAPEKFLREAGAMEGIEEFNGIYDGGGSRLDVDGKIDVATFSIITSSIIIVHEPIPYPNPCTWHIFLQ